MKKLLLGTIASLAMIASASAADMAARPYTKAPPPVMEAYHNWSGFYIGANGGWASSRKCLTINEGLGGFILAGTGIPNDEGCHDATGGTVGGQIGYRWQSAAWVFGIEAQGNWADLKGSNRSPYFTNSTNRSTIDAFGLFTGQVGYSWNNMLLYVKGGAAVTRDKYDSILTNPGGGFAAGSVIDFASETRWGAVVGVGGEYSFSPNWSLALEYDHLFMGGRDVAFTIARPGPFAFSPFTTSRVDRVRQDVDMVTARINYRFGGPVVARY